MSIFLGGADSAMDAEAKKKYLSEKDLNEILSNSNSTRLKLQQSRNNLYDRIKFYDRIIMSINKTIQMVSKKTVMSHSDKKDNYYDQHDKELVQAKKERLRLKNLLKLFDEKIKTLES